MPLSLSYSMRLLFFCVLSLAPFAAEPLPHDRPRLIVLTDIGGDPDDQQSLIRLLVHANEFSIEGLIASASGTPGELKQDIVKPELIHQTLDAYAQVQPQLAQHAQGFPAAADLKRLVQSGNPQRGITQIGADKDTPGSNWIIQAAGSPDRRPLNIVIWGGSTELAQALWRVRHDRFPAQLTAFLQKLRVYSISHQDDTGPWIVRNFPQLFLVLGMQPEGRDKRESAYRGMYLDGEEQLTSLDWVNQHVRIGHGPLGALYPTRTWTAPNPHSTLKEGDTPSWFYFLPIGLSDPSQPEWGGWGGRFLWRNAGLYRDVQDSVENQSSARATVWRWRPAFQREFQARMDWCVQPPADANHPPVAVLNQDASIAPLWIPVAPGQRVSLHASGSSDPDRHSLHYKWWIYPEPSNLKTNLAIEQPDSPSVTVSVPNSATNQVLHVLLAVSDTGAPPLTRYRRAVLAVHNPSAFERDIQAFEAADKANPPPRQAILFLGSSSIRLWPNLASAFPGRSVIQRGFGGSQIIDSLRYADRIVIPYQPATIIFYAGDNDIASGKSPQHLLAEFQAFERQIHKALPKTHIAFLAIKASIARWHLIDKIRAANWLIESHCRTSAQLSYIDVFTPMLNDAGQPRPELLQNDKLHLTQAGYDLWNSIVQSHLAQRP